jgi:hypothetical protein
MKAGGVAMIHFDDLQFNGQSEDFAKEPADWVGVGNRATFEDHEPTGAHNFGYSAETQHSGGEKAGEIGGGLWRGGPFAYYADAVGPLDLEHAIEARGKIKMVTAGPDSDIVLGFFNSASAKEKGKGDAANFIGIHIGGPTRVGHYFSPGCANAKGVGAKAEKGPILTPGKVFDWSLAYDPAANNDAGQITVTLGKDSVALPLKPGQKSEGATLDRFGLFTITTGGQMVKVYLDDLTYTAKQE